MEDIYFWRKHGRPPVEKDKVRSSIAECYLSHLKTFASLMKSVYSPESTHPPIEHEDFVSNIIYSLNKNRRWEAEESVGVDLLNDLKQFNNGWIVSIVERVTLRSYSRSASVFGSCPHRFEEFYPIKKLHYLNNEDEFKQRSVDSIFGKIYVNFLEDKSNLDGQDHRENSESIVSYNFLRSPNNYLKLLKKRFQPSNYGPYYDWPRAGYWNRLNREEDMLIDLRYEELEDLDKEHQDDYEDEEADDFLESKPEFYNLEDHFVDRFVIVKRRNRKLKNAL